MTNIHFADVLASKDILDIKSGLYCTTVGGGGSLENIQILIASSMYIY